MRPLSSDITPGSLPSEKIIRSSVKRRGEFFLGSGGNAEVFTVEHYPRYVVRIPRLLDLDHAPKFGAPNIIDDPLFEGRNFGQAIAEFKNGVAVLLKQQGIPIGVPPYLRKRREEPDIQEKNDKLYEDSTRFVASMHEEAYRELIMDMEFLNNAGKRIDPSKSNNLLVDVKNNKFNLVDISDNNQRRNRNKPTEAVVVLLDNSYGYIYKGQKEEELQKNRRIILDKLLTAAENLGVPFLHDRSDGIEGDSSLRYSLKLAGYEEGTPRRLEIEKRILSTGKTLYSRPAKVGNGRFAPDRAVL
jgi:hypothetical protein